MVTSGNDLQFTFIWYLIFLVNVTINYGKYYILMQFTPVTMQKMHVIITHFYLSNQTSVPTAVLLLDAYCGFTANYIWSSHLFFKIFLSCFFSPWRLAGKARLTILKFCKYKWQPSVFQPEVCTNPGMSICCLTCFLLIYMWHVGLHLYMMLGACQKSTIQASLVMFSTGLMGGGLRSQGLSQGGHTKV